MRIAITGTKGFIGRNLFNHLSRIWPVVGFDREDRRNLFNEAFDLVFHLGAISDTRCQDLALLQELNVEYTEELFEWAERNGTHVVYASSAALYATRLTPYARTKAAIEGFAHGRFCGLRYFNVYGDDEASKGRAASFIYKAKHSEGPVELFDGTLDAARDWVPLQLAMEMTIAFGISRATGVFDVGTGKAVTFRQILEDLGKAWRFIPMPDELKNTYQYFTQAYARNDRR